MGQGLVDVVNNLDFELGDFVNQSEVSEYLEVGLNVKELNLKETLKEIESKAFIEVNRVINQTLTILDIDSYFNNEELNKLKNKIGKAIAEGICSTNGYSLVVRKEINKIKTQKESFNQELQTAFGDTSKVIQSIAITGTLEALNDVGANNPITKLTNKLKEAVKSSETYMTDLERDIQDKKKELHDADVEEVIAKSVLTYYNNVITTTENDIDDLLNNINLTKKIYSEDSNFLKNVLDKFEDINTTTVYDKVISLVDSLDINKLKISDNINLSGLNGTKLKDMAKVKSKEGIPSGVMKELGIEVLLQL